LSNTSSPRTSPGNTASPAASALVHPTGRLGHEVPCRHEERVGPRERIIAATLADHREELLQDAALAVEQQLVAGVEDPQVAEHLPLVREEGGVAAASLAQPLDVVGHLAVQEHLRLRAGERELAALGAVDEERVGRVHHSVSS
jgi:hypothetical protein